jgi:hypothetical protein
MTTGRSKRDMWARVEQREADQLKRKQDEAMAILRESVPRGSTVYTNFRRASRWRTRAEIGLVVYDKQRPLRNERIDPAWHPEWAVSLVLGLRLNARGDIVCPYGEPHSHLEQKLVWDLAQKLYDDWRALKQYSL